MLGWNSDGQIINNIMLDNNEAVNEEMMKFLKAAFDVKYSVMDKAKVKHTQADNLQYFAEQLEPYFNYLDVNKNPENYQKITQFILEQYDGHFLQHLGVDIESREKKMRYLCLIILKMFKVKLKIIQQTNRDSFRNKRVHTAGINIAKIFKTHFNASIIQSVKRKLLKELASVSFFQINLATSLESSFNGSDFEKSITQAIAVGTKSEIIVNKKKKVNRLSTQIINRKNELNAVCTTRQITAMAPDNSKQSDRAIEMRRIHPSTFGYICLAHSPEGEKVGLNKQLALFATMTRASISEPIKLMLINDPDVFPLNTITSQDIRDGELCNIYINGDWIGCCTNAFELANKYREKRRNFELPPEITIRWENLENELYFWTDVGRMIRPLMIVYNNYRDPEKFPAKMRGKGKFVQTIALTKAHIAGIVSKKITIQDLLRDGVIEYITSDEQENLLVAPSFGHLSEERHNELNEYTHCDIAQAMFGLTAITSPYANHNQIPRLQYQTSQSKQTCGRPSNNWANRCDKDTYLQYASHSPLTGTVLNRYLNPNGLNCIVAIAINGGFNQEDSVIINKAASDRGLFNGCKWTFKESSLEQNEEFRIPDPLKTGNMKPKNYSKLDPKTGIVTKGMIIKKDDVIIGKVYKNIKSDDEYQYDDRSVIYKDEEEAIVHRIIIDRDEDDEQFCRVVLRKVRPITIGDKFSNRSGQKGVCGIMMKEVDMPFTREGIRPSIIFNPHGIPKRMTIGQLYESLIGNWCAEKATRTDGTTFREVNIKQISDELEQLGLNRHGNHRMFNGVTGEYIDVEIFMGPVYYQRLQKFTADTQYAVARGSSDVMTGLPLDGKSSMGGLRLGEMERDVLCAHGASKMLSHKFFDHADGITEYVCRCGKPAIVNVKENYYKCAWCKDNADIVAFPSSTSSKLLFHEIQSCNVGIRKIPARFVIEKMDTEIMDSINQILMG